jgi:hypothetical protein
MFKAVLRRVVYFGIPLAMWVIGSACVDPPPQPVVHNASYRCSRVGCDQITVAPANAGAPACACGAPTVVDGGSRVTGGTVK